ncbi:MAG TPA: hypothetical protein VFE33_21225 [Thermoanaerobaculia bacterium]|nr:hypothetical protein [Thermoanaerobaculia bacterium]
MASHRRTSTSVIAVLATTIAGLFGPAPRLAATTLTVGVACYSLGHGRLQCEADAAGGTGPYTYAWSPTPSAGGGSEGLAIIPCSPYQYRTVSVTVTDANSDIATDSGSFYCGDAV